MKRLKRSHLFNGKTYPYYATIIVMFVCMFSGIGFTPMFALTPLMIILTLVICFIRENTLSDSERRMISQLPYPLWEPVTPEIRQLVTEQQEHSQLTFTGMILSSAVLGGLAFGVMVTPSRGSRSSFLNPPAALGIAALIAAITFICLLIRNGISENWLEMDDSAVYTKVPIDHMYDVIHHGKHGRTWITSYLVFYQPDGRYVLSAPKGCGDCNTVIIVKYGKALTWMPIYEHHPEEYM